MGIRKLDLNENCFEEISPECAYWIGFIAADGNISSRKDRPCTKLFTIGLMKSDFGHLLKLKNFMGSSHKLCKRGPNAIQFHVSNKKMYEDLKKWGMKERKSKKNYSFLDYIPESYRDEFIFGYFDGDGSVYLLNKRAKYKDKVYRYKIWNINFVSNQKTIYDIKKHLVEKHGMSDGPSVCNVIRNSYRVCWTRKKDVKKFSEIYFDSPIHLDRKLVRFQEMVKMQGGV